MSTFTLWENVCGGTSPAQSGLKILALAYERKKKRNKYRHMNRTRNIIIKYGNYVQCKSFFSVFFVGFPVIFFLHSLKRIEWMGVCFTLQCFHFNRDGKPVHTYILATCRQTQWRYGFSFIVWVWLILILPFNCISGCILAELYTGYPLFPGENEVEQLACIMEILGLPSDDLINNATRRRLFFGKFLIIFYYYHYLVCLPPLSSSPLLLWPLQLE